VLDWIEKKLEQIVDITSPRARRSRKLSTRGGGGE